ncbi:hypothetical protein MTR67_049614 [Solanum verrucosum]|uniref:Uncharacterized protein n=1 Tax=Solanum verrucosum TaxID=315347 RepID=A0AAF0V2U1_SOLVR|nr:hypothetical protein MTR67_049614 [Solanum verrucosum]
MSRHLTVLTRYAKEWNFLLIHSTKQLTVRVAALLVGRGSQKSLFYGVAYSGGTADTKQSTEKRPDYVLMAKLKALKGKLKEWRKTIQGNLKMQKALVLKQLADLEEIQEQRALEEREIASRLALTMEFGDIAKHEEIAWRQRSRALWLKQGDRNTSFFHRTANQHRRINNIDKLKVNGVEIVEPEEIKK